jgi:Methyltransferase domain
MIEAVASSSGKLQSDNALDRGGDASALLAKLPKLHYWGGAEQVGGLNALIGERMIAELARYDLPRVVETGAGATTLLFCCLDPAALTSIAPVPELRDRILAEAEARDITTDRLRYICERSEIALPRIAADNECFDVGLIDGCHNWPSVFVDFCYINMMMPEGGTLFVDDIHLYSVSQLYRLLRQQTEFEWIALDDKLATFRKVVDGPFLPEWKFEPYIEENSPVTSP